MIVICFLQSTVIEMCHGLLGLCNVSGVSNTFIYRWVNCGSENLRMLFQSKSTLSSKSGDSNIRHFTSDEFLRVCQRLNMWSSFWFCYFLFHFTLRNLSNHLKESKPLLSFWSSFFLKEKYRHSWSIDKQSPKRWVGTPKSEGEKKKKVAMPFV